jgi:hypothetical protein
VKPLLDWHIFLAGSQGNRSIIGKFGTHSDRMEHAMTDGTVFGLQARHLGMNSFREIHLHAEVSATLDRIRNEVPGCVVDVRDGHGDRVAAPGPAGAFVTPVEIFDVPAEAPRQLVVHGEEAAARVGDALPDLVRLPAAGPADGVAFELDREHLGKDRFGLVYLNDDVMLAIASVVGDTAPAQCRVLDGEGLPVKPPRQPSPVGGREGSRFAGFEPGPVSGLNGFEPRYVVFHDRGAAERFARLYPAMRQDALDGLERTWRAARRS